MDEKDKKIKELEDALKVEKDGRVADKIATDKLIADKDLLIKQKTEDVVGARSQYKKLSEMTEAEKAEMSAKEIELQTRQEEFDARQKKFEDDQKAFTQKEVDARRERAISKIAGSDVELRAKVGEAFKKIIDHDKAQTDEEIAAVATSAFNMLGVPKPDPVRSAMGGEGGAAAGGEGGGENFADQKAGKDLAAAMNLPVEPPKAADGK